MTTIPIERGIPIPPKKTTETKYPWRDMAVGDSFTIPLAAFGNVRVAAFRFGKKNGMRFCSRKDGDQVRVWRTA